MLCYSDSITNQREGTHDCNPVLEDEFERCLVRLGMSVDYNVISNSFKNNKILQNSDALPTPLNIRLRQTSATSMEVSWDELHGKNPLNVLGYRIYYSSTPNANLDKWSIIDIGPGTSAEVHGLDPSTTYSVRIRARGSDGRFGILSDQVVSNRLDYGCNFRVQLRLLISQFLFEASKCQE